MADQVAVVSGRVEAQLQTLYVRLLFARREVERLEDRIDGLEAMKLVLTEIRGDSNDRESETTT